MAQMFDPKSLLPHRAPMLLLDSVSLEKDVATGQKTIRPEEFFLQGHFPGHPVVPGVILCEILAQTACVLFPTSNEKQVPMLTGLNDVRFRHPVFPGDCLETEVRIVKQKGPFAWAEGQARVNGKVCLDAKFSFAIVEKP